MGLGQNRKETEERMVVINRIGRSMYTDANEIIIILILHMRGKITGSFIYQE